MGSTTYNKNNYFANTVAAGVFLGVAAITPQPVGIQSTKHESVFFIEQSSRYGDINLDGFQSTMTPFTFAVFKDFIGEDNYEIHPDDFDVFYPDDEV
jgi:hypothetical protein